MAKKYKCSVCGQKFTEDLIYLITKDFNGIKSPEYICLTCIQAIGSSEEEEESDGEED